MNEHFSSADMGGVAGSLGKFLPAALGAGIMILVDPPKTKRELFTRAFIALAMSYLFGGAMFDFLQSFSLFAFLDDAKRTHHTAVDGLIGACGWFVAGGVAQWLQKFRKDPIEASRDIKSLKG